MDEKNLLSNTTEIVTEAGEGLMAGSPSATHHPAMATPESEMSRWQRLRLIGLVVLKRVRFIAVLVAVGVFIGYWDVVMNYWEKWTESRSAASHALEHGHEFYCPMDPQVIRTTYEPNGDVPKCPICGMPLSIRKIGEKVTLPEGITGRVQLSPERIQLAGIKTVPIDYRAASRQTRTVGYIAYDEARLSRIVSRVDGYVEKLYVNETYSSVHAGDPLAEIYSPELYSTSKELVLASRGGGTGEMAAAARNKLGLLGVDPQEIDAITSSGKPSPRLVLRSPQAGYVVEKRIVAGASVDAKMTLFEVADLSTVWIEAEVYENDIPFLQVGQPADITVEAYPDRRFGGTVALVYPRVETATRTNRVRLKLDNPRHELRPGMYAAVRINTPLETIEPYRSAAIRRTHLSTVSTAGATAPTYEFLTVPERAVIDTGSKKVVYVEREAGLFEGVEVELGPRYEGAFPVLKGLKQGDKVAAAGGFLIDAETRLNPAAASTYFGASGGPQTASRPASAPAAAAKADAPDPKTKAMPPAVLLTAENLKNIEQLPEADRKLALAQRICPVTGLALGSMGVPIKTTLRDQTVFLCCKGCLGKAKRSPDELLKKLAEAAK